MSNPQNQNLETELSSETVGKSSNDTPKTPSCGNVSTCSVHPKIVKFIKDTLTAEENLTDPLSREYLNELTELTKLLDEPCMCSPSTKADILCDLLKFIEENKTINPSILEKYKNPYKGQMDDLLKYSQDFKDSMKEVLENIIGIIFLQLSSGEIDSGLENDSVANRLKADSFFWNNQAKASLASELNIDDDDDISLSVEQDLLAETSRNINVLSDCVLRERSEPLNSNLSTHLVAGNSQNDDNIEFVIGDNAVIKNQNIACECRPHEYGAAVPMIYSNLSYITPQIQANNEPEQRRVYQETHESQQELPLGNTDFVNSEVNSTYEDSDENIHELFENKTYVNPSDTTKLDELSEEQFKSTKDFNLTDPEKKVSSEEQLLKVSQGDSDLIVISMLSESVDEIFHPNGENLNQNEAEEDFDDDDDDEGEETDASVSQNTQQPSQTKSIKRCPKEFTLQKREKTADEHSPALFEPDIKENAQKKSSGVINIKSATECPYQSQIIFVEETRNAVSQPLKYTVPQIFTVVNLPLTYFNVPNKIHSSGFVKSTVGFVLHKQASDIVLEKLTRSMPQISSKVKLSVSMVQTSQREVVNVLKENVSKTARLKQEQICNRLRRNPSSKRNTVATH